MKIKLPWKRKSSDGKFYWAKLEINYGTFHSEEIFKRWKKILLEKNKTVVRFKKRKRSGLKKCPGHDTGSQYDDQGKCNKCGAWK